MNVSSPYADKSRNTDDFERYQVESRSMISRKNDDIARITREIENAEKELAALRSILAEKKKLIEASVSEPGSPQSQVDTNTIIEDIKAEQEDEIARITKKHEDEIRQLKVSYQKSIEEARKWGETRAQSTIQERTSRLTSLRKELNSIKLEAKEATLSITQKRTAIFQESKSAAISGSQRVQHLEAQLLEISSLSREEIRDIRAKIDECIATIEIRKREYENDAAKCEAEVVDREEKYNAHSNLLNEEFTAESQRLQSELKASIGRNEALEKALRQLGKQHEQQLRVTLGEVEKLKAKTYSMRESTVSSVTDKAKVSRIQSIQTEAKQIESEIKIVEEESADLTKENESLRKELEELDRRVYGRNEP